MPIQAVGNRETGPGAKVFPQEGDDQPLFFVEAPYTVVGKIGIAYLLFPFVSKACFLDVAVGERPWIAFPPRSLATSSVSSTSLPLSRSVTYWSSRRAPT